MAAVLVHPDAKVEVYELLSTIVDLLSTYGLLFAAVIPADEKVMQRAIRSHQATPKRLPTVDALIAVTASLRGVVLMHHDPHLGRIPKMSWLRLVYSQVLWLSFSGGVFYGLPFGSNALAISSCSDLGIRKSVASDRQEATASRVCETILRASVTVKP